MNKLSKNLLVFLGVSFSLVPNPLTNCTEVSNPVKNEKEVDHNLQLTDKKYSSVENYRSNLNQTKVYLLVKPQIKKHKNTLLLLESGTRIGSEFSSFQSRYKIFTEFCFDPFEAKKTSWLKNKTDRLLDRNMDLYWTEPDSNKRNISFLLTYAMKLREINFVNLFKMSRESSLIDAPHLRNNKSHYKSNNDGGYKSISPVFLDTVSAESFLLENYRYNSIRNSGVDQTKKFADTKEKIIILKLGLGDLVSYYSTVNKKAGDKVEFIIFPSLKESSTTTKSLAQDLDTKSFKDLQKDLYKAQKMS